MHTMCTLLIGLFDYFICNVMKGMKFSKALKRPKHINEECGGAGSVSVSDDDDNDSIGSERSNSSAFLDQFSICTESNKSSATLLSQLVRLKHLTSFHSLTIYIIYAQ